MTNRWTRREFVRGAAGVVALPRWLPQQSNPRFAYVASANNSIHAFDVRGEQWTPMQRIASEAPAAIAISADTLYVANDIRIYDRLPRGSVECFRIGGDGRLTAMGRAALSLSATHPRSLAISPDGKLLAVASQEDGIYNLFVIAADGSLETPRGIFKDTGGAHPNALHFDLSGTRLISSDADSDRRNVFAVEHGRLRRVEESALAATAPEVRVVGKSIYYRSVRVADVPAARNVALRT
jgi:6-phosphogluconolactonase (cycloisomerase 2 family)